MNTSSFSPSVPFKDQDKSFRVARHPWAGHPIPQDDPNRAGRQKWRDTFATAIQTTVPFAERTGGADVGFVSRQAALLLVATTCSDKRKNPNFVRHPDDLKRLLRWMGQLTARCRWRRQRDRGDGDGLSAMENVAVLFLRQCALCGTEDNEDLTEVARVTRTEQENRKRSLGMTEPMRSWPEARQDLHEFLTAWSTERACMGQRKPRKVADPSNSNRSARDVCVQLWLLRALEHTHPGALVPGDLTIIRTMTNALNASVHCADLARAVLALDDRDRLETVVRSGRDPQSNEPSRKRRM